MKIVPNGRINYEPASIKKMVRCRTGDKPLSELMLVRLTVVVAHKSLGLDELTHTYYDIQHILITPYPKPVYTGWSSVHWNATGMLLVDPVYTGIPLEKLS